MAINRYPSQLQAIYSELLGRTQQADLEGLVQKEASLAAKEVSGRRYWYARRRIGQRVDERYIGPESPELLQRIDTMRAEAEDAKAAARGRRDLIRLLRAGGYPVPDARTGRTLQALAAAGVFRLRGVLVGTHAFRCYGAALGVRLPEQAAFTTDVDIAQFETVSIAVEDRIEPGFAEALQQAERFLPVPSLHDRTGPTAWRTPDLALSVELLTPRVGPDHDGPVKLPALAAHATPLRFLDYLIHRTEPATVPFGAGILVSLPQPERYACHKLIVAQRRSITGRTKAAKDLAQAAALLTVLLEDRPDDVADAWAELLARGPAWRRAALASHARLPAEVRERLDPEAPAEADRRRDTSEDERA